MSVLSAPARTILYATEAYRATQTIVSPEALTVVLFDYWTDQPSLDVEAPGESFFIHQGLNTVGIKTAANDWYQGAEMPALCRAVVAATPGHRRVGYGGSMGGYAAINFAGALGLDCVIALCPQFSIDPVRAPFELRWRKEARASAFGLDQVGQAPPRSGYVVFDPGTVDGLHADRILRGCPGLEPLRVRHAGHDLMPMLQQCGLLAEMLLDMVHGRFCAAAFLAAVRRRRRASGVFWLNLARTLADHGRYAAAQDALLHARTLPRTHGPPFKWQFRAAVTECVGAVIHGGGRGHGSLASWIQAPGRPGAR